MLSESEIHNFKKIFLDEMGCYSRNNEAEKAFDESFEKVRNLDFSEVHDEKEAIDQFCEKFEIRPELAAYFKDNFFMTWTLQMKKTSEVYRVLSWVTLTKNRS